MTNEAQKHLDKALQLLAKGDEFYRKAKPEISAAIAAGASQVEVARFLARSRKWVQDVLAWDGTGTLYAKDTGRRQADMAKQILREAPLEQVEQMIDSLPEDRKLAIAAAAGSGYHKERLKENERVKNLTPAEKKEIEAAKAGITDPINKALGGFATLGVVGHLEQATEDLSQMIADNAVTAESIYRIDQAHDLFVTELEVAKAMAGLGEESIV